MIINGQEFISKALEDKVVDLNNPNCSNCNECCSYATMITDEEYERLKKYFKTSGGKRLLREAKRKHEEKAKKYNSINFMCPFSSKTKRCMIYSLRPKICVDFHCKKELNKVEDSDRTRRKGYVIGDLIK